MSTALLPRDTCRLSGKVSGGMLLTAVEHFDLTKLYCQVIKVKFMLL